MFAVFWMGDMKPEMKSISQMRHELVLCILKLESAGCIMHDNAHSTYIVSLVGGWAVNCWSSLSLSMITILPSWNATINWLSEPGSHLIIVTGLSLMIPCRGE